MMLRSASRQASRAVVQRTSMLGSLGHRYMASGKDIRFGTDCRNLMLDGVDMIADAVQTTLGPKGRNVVIDQSFGAPKITKDGVTVAKSIEFEDRYHNLGAQLVRSVASKTNDVAGDGTTTATVLARAIFAEGVKAVAAGMNPMDLRRGINSAVTQILENLTKKAKDVSSKEEIGQVGTISSNGDASIGDMIAEAMDKVGSEGVITVENGRTLVDELEIVEGMNFDRGFISPYFITDQKTQRCVLENPLILLIDSKISNIQSLLPIFEDVVRAQREFLIICEDLEGEALAAVIMNRLRGIAKVAAVKSPGFGENRKGIIQDISCLTGGHVISEELGLKLENLKIEMLGNAEKVMISKQNTLILGGGGDKDEIKERCDSLREAINDKSVTGYDKEKLQERLAKLASGVAVLKVGGGSEVEVGERRDRVDDALNATQAAVAEGIVPGGGMALLYASCGIDVSLAENFDQAHGMKIVKNALKIPAKSIIDNAGEEGSVIVGRLLEDFEKNGDFNRGYDAATGKYVDMLEGGIVDPVKVVRTALSDSASVAGLMTTTEAMVVEIPKTESSGGSPGAGMPNPMGGMGGMGF